MNIQYSEILALINDFLEAVIVIFGAAVVLYNAGRTRRDPVTRSFVLLIAFVVIAYLAELLVSRAIVPDAAESLLRIQWIGITMVPPAQIQLSSTLLSTTGLPPRRRKIIIPLTYLIGLLFLGLVLFTDIVVAPITDFATSVVPHLQAGPAIPFFTLYFWLVTFASIYNVWRARQRCLTRTTRQRMTSTMLAFVAAPLGVFPYLILTGQFSQDVPVWLWPVIILGNLVVSMMFGVLTAHIIYFGATTPDRVVRVRLYKFMARVPLAGSIVLIVFIIVSRNSPIFGLPTETALGFALVVTVMLVEWAIHAYKKPLERLFQLNDDPDVRRIQMLSERLVTTRDLQEFLESVLAATCEALRTPTAFVTAITNDGPQMEAVVGPLTESDAVLENEEIQRMARPSAEADTSELDRVEEFFIWQDYWIRPLYNRQDNMVLGILGVRARADEPDLNEDEEILLEKLVLQASHALEDRILQQEVFATVEGLLPQITALQERRRAATFGGLPVLTQATIEENQLVDDPEFNQMVRDALRDYWGGPRLTSSPLMRLEIVQQSMIEHENNPTKALRAILNNAIELQKPEGERSMTTAEWILYNILELKFVQGQRVRDIARRLAMSESDLYRKQRIAIENVARTITKMERNAANGNITTPELADQESSDSSAPHQTDSS